MNPRMKSSMLVSLFLFNYCCYCCTIEPFGSILVCATCSIEINGMKHLHVDRRRKPRTFRDDGLLTLYNQQDAFAAELLYEANEGSYMRKSNQITLLTNAEPEKPLYYMPSKDESNIYLITTRNVLCVKLSNKSIQWVINPMQIKSVTSGQHDEIVIIYTEGSSNSEKKLCYRDPKYLKRFKEHLLSIQFRTKKNSRN